MMPLFKRSRLDKEDMKHYQLNLFLPFTSKLMDKLVVTHTEEHTHNNDLHDCYRSDLSTENTQWKVQ